jgi:PPOX class probable F420-dependent enzyme
MAAKIPDTFLDLFEKRAFAQLATVMPSGTPQVTPLWVDFDGEYVLINSAKGRKKDLNMAARPQVGLSILDPDNPYRYLALRGRVVEITEDGADAHIAKLAKKYTGRDHFQKGSPDEVRRIYKIAIDHVDANG